MDARDLQALRDAIRCIPDYPKPGIVFRDITTLLGDAPIFRLAVTELSRPWDETVIGHVAGIEARGFILGGAVAHRLGAGFVPIRKKGKLPFDTVEQSYELEYGSATVEIHTDALQRGQRVLLIDDLIATGGTMLAGKRLIEKLGGDVVEGAAIVDLPELGGSQLLRDGGLKLFTLVDYAGH